MWEREEIVSSSDESLEEEISPGISGGFETAAGACKLKPVFDNIFADIQASIPTLDLEDSSEESNDNEEPLFYTRKVWPLSPNILSQASLPSSKPVGSPAASASDSGLSLVSPDGHMGSSSSLSDCEQDSVEFLGSSPILLPSTLPVKSVISSSTQTASADVPLPTSTAKTKHTTSAATADDTNTQDTVELKFDLIEHLNLGELLERTNEVTLPPLFPPIPSDSENSDSEDSGNSLMEELVRLSRRQQNAAAPEPISPIEHHSAGTESVKNKRHDVGVTSGPSVTSTGVTACLDPPTTNKSTHTVFLDLRRLQGETLPQRHQALPSSICRILGISNEAEDLSSSSDEEDDLQHWQDQRRKAKEASLSCARQNDSNVDHRLPKKPVSRQQNAAAERKPAHKEILQRLHEKVVQPVVSKDIVSGSVEIEKSMVGRGTSAKLDNAGVSLKKTQGLLKGEKVQGTKQAWVAKSQIGIDEKPHQEISILDKTVPQKDLSQAQEKALSSPVKGEIKTVNSKVSPSKRDDLSSIDNRVKKDLISPRNEIKKTSVKHKQVLTEEEKAKRQRLQRSLQNLKPQVSSHGHHPAAPLTPVLFHEEASYASDVISLPDLDTSLSYLLMSTKLSSCGELTALRQGSRGTTTPETHCFAHLVAWLACLVCPSVNTPDYAEVCGAPFYVVALRQSWHEGQLKMEIGICSRLEKGENQKKIKANSFRQAVSKFLSTNSLHSAYSRLFEFTPCPLQHISEMLISKKNLSTLLTVNPDPEAMHRVFVAKPGFFWQTMEVEDAPAEDKTGVRLCQGPGIQHTVMLMQYAVFHEPFCLLDVLIRVRVKALDISGVRLVYQQKEVLEEKPAYGCQLPNTLVPEEMYTSPLIPVLVLALRGPEAISRWQDEVGPVDSKLAQRTDPNSLRALFSNGAKEDHLFWCPRNAQSAGTELARWFGGRVPESGVINIGSNEPVEAFDEKPKGNSLNGKGRNQTKSQLLTSPLHTTSRPPPHFLTTTTDTSIFFIVSPAVPVKYLGPILCMCFEKGFCVQGIKRLRLNPNLISGLGLAPEVLSMFCPKRVNQSEKISHTPSAVASTVLLLRRENSIHHTLSVVKPLVDSYGLSQSSFLSVSYSDSMFKQLGGDFSHTPDPAAYPVDLLRHAFHSNPELEQVCVVTLLKEKATISAGAILTDLLLEKETQDLKSEKSFELLGLKLLSPLSMHQAKEFTPCKIGDDMWKRSLHTLTAGPALVLALRGVDAFARLQRFVDSHSDLSKPNIPKDSISVNILMSCTPELACRQLSVIFFDRELFSDQSARRNLHLLPPPRRVINGGSSSGSSESLNEADASRKQRNRRVGLSKLPLKASLGSVETLKHADMSVLQSLLAKPRVIPTVCVLKPRIATKHLGKLLKRLGQEGFSVTGLKMTSLTPAEVSALMARQEKDLERHVSHMTSGPVVALCLQRENAVGRLLDVLGPSDARLAKKQSQFFLRGSFGEDSIHNAFYGSETYVEAIRDVKLLFPEGVCCPPTIDLKADEIPCLALDEIFSVTANRALVELTAEEQTRVDTSPGMTLLPSSLLEINCIVLLPQMLAGRAQQGRRGASISYAEIIEALLTAGFHFIGLRMLLLGVAEAADCAKLYSACLPSDWKPHHLRPTHAFARMEKYKGKDLAFVSELFTKEDFERSVVFLKAGQLSKTPCLVMAVLRDGAVTCYDTLCDSSPKLRSLAANSGRYMLAGKTLKESFWRNNFALLGRQELIYSKVGSLGGKRILKTLFVTNRYLLAVELFGKKAFVDAKRMVECFFDRLIPNRKARIELSPT